MPPKKNSQKCKSNGHYKPKKRKVISPLQISERISHTKTNNSDNSNNRIGNNDNNGRLKNQPIQWSDICVSPGSDQISYKRFHGSQPDYFDFGQYFTPDNLTPAISMSFQQIPQMPFGSQYMTSPPYNTQFPAAGAGPNSPAPQWATQIMDDIKSIKISVSKIDGIEKMVHNINSKVNELESKVKNMDSKVAECEKSSQFVSNEFEKTKKDLKSANDDLKRLNNKCKDFEKAVTDLETKNKTLEDKSNDLEFRSLRENLLFHGIAEGPNENCEDLVHEFLTQTLEIGQMVKIDRAHRLGKPKGRVRPIVVKFHSYKDREMIRTTATEKSDKLKGLNQGVGVQQTKAVLNKRRDMNAIFDREKAAGRQVKWAGAKLLVRDGNVGKFREVTE